MTLEQLRIFVAVAEREHVTRAAKALNLTQSAVSAAIAALEGRYGVPLFNRVGRHIELTVEGRVFEDQARAVLAQAAQAERALSDMSGLTRGTLVIQASHTVASYWLPRHLMAFHRTYPQIDVKLTIGNTAQVAESICNGSAELGFVEGAVQEPELESFVVARERLIVIVQPNHPWAKLKVLRPTQLLEESWILREPGSGTRSEFEAALKTFGISIGDLKVAMELPSNEAVHAAVTVGGGAAALSELVVVRGLLLGTLAKARIRLPSRIFELLRHRERNQSRAADAFVALMTTNGQATPNWVMPPGHPVAVRLELNSGPFAFDSDALLAKKSG